MPKLSVAAFFVALLSAGLAGSAAAQTQPAASPAPAVAPSAAPAATPAPASPTRTLYRIPADDKWHLVFAPYLWAPNINGSVHFNVPSIRLPDLNRPVDVGASIGPTDYLSNLNFAIQFSGEVRRDALSVFFDFINANLNSTTGQVRSLTGPRGNVEVPVDTALSTHFRETFWALAPGYTVLHGVDGNVDVEVGYRQASINTSAAWHLNGPLDLVNRNGSASLNQTYGDFITGLRGNLYLAPRWYVPYYGDLGWGNNNSTWQAFGGLGFAGRTTDVVLLYRNLQYNDTRLQIVRMGGPELGVVFHW